MTVISGFLVDKLGNFCKSAAALAPKALPLDLDWLCLTGFVSVQSGYMCSPSCVFRTQRCLRWAPTSEGRPTCCR